MKAAVATRTGVEIREVPAPVPGRNQVLVRVRDYAHFGKIVLAV